MPAVPGYYLPMPRCIFLDFFGTLVEYDESRRLDNVTRSLDLLRPHAPDLTIDGLRELLDSIYAPFEAEANAAGREYHTDDAMRSLLHQLNAPTDASSVRRMSHAWIDDWRGPITPFAGLASLLDDLGIPLWIVSNTSTPWLVGDVVDDYNLSHLFDGIITSVETGTRKPARQIFEAALNASGYAAQDVLFVGDNPDCDYHGPRTFGMRSLLVGDRPDAAVPEDHRLATILELGTHPMLA